MNYDDKAHKRARYADLKARGLCTSCGNAPARAGKAQCGPCALHHAAYQIAYKAEHPGHRTQMNHSKRAQRLQRKAEGKCVACGACPPRTGRALCEECAAKHATYAARIRENHPERGAWYVRKSKYGISREAWEAMFASQGERCAICGCDDPGGNGGWHTDHDHAAGNVRAILCNGCNVGLGGFRDNPEWLEKAAAYLRDHRARRLVNVA